MDVERRIVFEFGQVMVDHLAKLEASRALQREKLALIRQQAEQLLNDREQVGLQCR